jgi:hypothetical protein
MKIIITFILCIAIFICSCSSYVAGGNSLDKYNELYAVVLQHHITKTEPAMNSTIHIYLAVEGEDPSAELLDFVRGVAPSIKNRSELKTARESTSPLYEGYISDNRYFTLSIRIHELNGDYNATVNCNTNYCCDPNTKIKFTPSIYYELLAVGKTWIIEDSWLPRVMY